MPVITVPEYTPKAESFTIMMNLPYKEGSLLAWLKNILDVYY